MLLPTLCSPQRRWFSSSFSIDLINIRTVFLVYPASTIVLAAVVLPGVDFRQLLPLQFKRERLQEMFDFTKWMMLGGTAVYFINWGDNLVLRLYVSLAAIGQYNLGYQVFKGIVTLIYTIGRYFLPFVAEHIENKDKMRAYLFNKRFKLMLLGVSCIAFVFFIIPYMFSAIYGETYRQSVSVVRILMIASVLVLYNTFYSPVLHTLKKYKVVQATSVMQVLANLLLDLILVPRWGMQGAAIATLVGYACTAVAMELYFRIKIRKVLDI